MRRCWMNVQEAKRTALKTDGLLETARAIFFDSYRDDSAMKLLNEWKPAHAAPLVQIAEPASETKSTLQQVSGD